jgi:nitrate reductase delta subunit
MLGDCAHIVRKVGETLAQRGSHYAAVLAAVLAVAAEPGLDWSKAIEPPPPEPPIDEEWADAPAFAPPAADAASPAVVRFIPRSPDAAVQRPHKGTGS